MKFLGNIDTTDVVLLDVKYAKPSSSDEDKTDYAMILLKNVKTGKKMVHNIPNPEMDIFFVKPELRNFNYNLSAISRDKVYPVRVKYKNVINEIAKEAGGEWKTYRDQCIEQRNFKAMNNLFHYPYTFGSDLDIRDYYRCMWNIHYYHPETHAQLHKAYLDIEADVVDHIGIPPKGTVPINAISVCDGKDKKMHTFLLRNAARENPLIAKFEKNIDDFYKLCHNTFDEEFPGFTYQIYMFDSEREMLIALFRVIKDIDADFMGIWNMDYDVPNIMERATYLSLDPIQLMCDHEFKKDLLYYWEDTNTGIPVEKKSYFDISSRTVWTDMMKNYGKIRKGRGVLRSVKLNAIAKKEIESEKLEYTGAYDKNLPYTDYIKFVLYNIKDVLLLFGIENKTEDMDNMYSRSIVNGSQFKSVFSQTKFLKNRFYIECYKDGYICGNNPNMDYSKGYSNDDDMDEEKFDGAVVGDPELNDYVGENIFGKPSKYVFSYVCDMDFSSMYPWSIISFNISAHTMLGKLLIDKEYYKGISKNDYEEDPNLKFEPGKEFLENLLSKDYIKMGVNWFNLPSVEEMLEELDDKFPTPKRRIINSEHPMLLDEPIYVGFEGV